MFAVLTSDERDFYILAIILAFIAIGVVNALISRSEERTAVRNRKLRNCGNCHWFRNLGEHQICLYEPRSTGSLQETQEDWVCHKHQWHEEKRP